MKRALCLLLCVCCVLSALQGFCFSAGAEETVTTSVETGPVPQKSGNKLIALTFDDGPGKDTPRLLNALRARGVHCTFFMVGYCAAAYPAVVKQCYEDGHQIASHTYDHPWLTKLSDDQIRSQLNRAANVFNTAIGASNTYMVRPPYGDYNQRVLNVLGVPAFYWSDDSGDWRPGATANSVYNNTIATAGDGDILLLHDSHSWSVDAAIRIVDTLLSKGYEFVTLSELFRRRGVQLQAGKIYSYLRANGTNLPGISKPAVKVEGTVSGETVVTLSADAGTTIYYTLDGTIPNANSTRYTGPFRITRSCKLTAVAGYDMNGSRSNPLSYQLNPLPRCAAPQVQISQEDGLVTITAAHPVYYTLDGSLPNESSLQYQAPFLLPPDTVLKARCYDPGAAVSGSDLVVRCFTSNHNVVSDVFPNDWYYPAIDYAISNGLLQGIGNDRLDPNGTVTRGMLVTVLYRIAGSPEISYSAQFSDVPEGKWYSNAVCWAAENHVVNGFSDGSFHPEEALTREQFATVLWRYSRSCDYYEGAEETLSSYQDEREVSAFARQAMSWAVENGFINGLTKTTLAPKRTATRAQLAAIFMRYQIAVAAWEPYYLDDAALCARAGKILTAMKEKDFVALAEELHPEQGLKITPFSYVQEDDRVLSVDELTTLPGTEAVSVWGLWDASGEPIEMTFDEFWNEFVWNADYTEAEHVGVNAIVRSGNAIENLTEAYPHCLFVDYEFDSLSGDETGFDWSSLKLVFQRIDGEWYWVGIVHGEWTT